MPQLQGPRVGIDPAGEIDDRIVIRKVDGSSPQKFRHQAALAAEAIAWKEEKPAPMKHDARVEKHESRAGCGDPEMKISFERGEQVAGLRCSCNLLAAGEEEMEAAQSGPGPGAARPDAVQQIDLGHPGRPGAWRQPRREQRKQRGVGAPDACADTVGRESKSTRPPETVQPLQSAVGVLYTQLQRRKLLGKARIGLHPELSCFRLGYGLLGATEADAAVGPIAEWFAYGAAAAAEGQRSFAAALQFPAVVVDQKHLALDEKRSIFKCLNLYVAHLNLHCTDQHTLQAFA